VHRPQTTTILAGLSIVAVVVLLAAWCFADVLFRDRLFAYRDTAYLYYPLYQFVEQEWSAGRVPLWSPFENCGTPLAANATAAVFYPGKLLFRLPIAYDAAFRAYVVLHVLLAAGMSYLLARRWNRTIPSAGLAALAYAFGGCVLFQYCNVIYLVSAAWLPAALATADRALVSGCRRAMLACGATLALMVLGGDPQTAYHAFLLIALYALLLRRTAPAEREQRQPRRWRYLVGFAGVALLLSAVQVLPTAEHASHSDRAAYEQPRSVWELAAAIASPSSVDQETSDWSRALRVASPPASSHEAGTYQFSLSPWRLPELLWPNYSGRTFPISRRWLTAIFAEGRIWVPSLYLGTFPLIFALAAFRLRKAAAPVRWMSWCTVVGLLASLGAYGPGWIAAELARHWLGAGEEAFPVGGGFGGLYWFINVVLPGYVQFRYPAKWLIVAALGMSQLAAVGLDTLLAGELRRLRMVSAVLMTAGALGFIMACAIFPWWSNWFAEAAPDTLFGPLDANGAWRDLATGLLQGTLLAAIACGLFSPRFATSRRRVAIAVVVVSTIDLALANGWMVLTAPMGSSLPASSVLAEFVPPSTGETSSSMVTAYRAPYWQPQRFAETSDRHRADESVTWDRSSLCPRYNLDADVRLVAVPGTVTSLDYAVLVPHLHREARDYDKLNANSVALSPALRLVGANFLIMPAPESREVVVRQLPAVQPRAWIAHHVDVMPPIDEQDVVAVRARTREVLERLGARDNRPIDAVVETAAPWPGVNLPERGDASHGTVQADSSVIVRDDVTRLELNVELQEPSLVVLADAYDPHWRARHATTGEELPIVRTNRVLRGVWLTAGEHRLVFEYQPRAFYFGAFVSGVAWLALVSGLGANVIRRYWVARKRAWSVDR